MRAPHVHKPQRGILAALRSGNHLVGIELNATLLCGDVRGKALARNRKRIGFLGRFEFVDSLIERLHGQIEIAQRGIRVEAAHEYNGTRDIYDKQKCHNDQRSNRNRIAPTPFSELPGTSSSTRNLAARISRIGSRAKTMRAAAVHLNRINAAAR